MAHPMANDIPPHNPELLGVIAAPSCVPFTQECAHPRVDRRLPPMCSTPPELSARRLPMPSAMRVTTTYPAFISARTLYCFWLGFCWLGLASCSSSPLSNTKDAGGDCQESAPLPAHTLSISSSGDTDPEAPPNKQPQGFEYPSDLLPHLTQILSPDTPALPPHVRQTHYPTSKAGPIPGAHWDPPASLKGPPFAQRDTKSDVRPPYPPERFSPYAVFVAAQPPKAPLPAGPGITTRAPDPSIPPPLPPLSRFTSERVGFDDPTSDTHHAFLLTSRPSISLPPVPFERTEIPDPHVFGEQIRPQLSPQLEPGRRPEATPPPRPSLP
jgi:hypothetical protein